MPCDTWLVSQAALELAGIVASGTSDVLDETRPTCKRCAKAKLECKGYRDLTVIQYSGSSKSQWSSTSLASSPPPSDSLQTVDFNELIPGPSLVPDPDNVFTAYAISRLLKGNEPTGPLSNKIERTLSDECWLALATSFFGYEHHEKSIVERGMVRYGSSLNRLHNALADTKSSKTYDVLESVMIMGFFEFLMSNTKDGWIAHSMGMQRLFELRGPESFQKQPDLSIFATARQTIIFASLVLKKSTILSQQRWKDVPWALNPSEKKLFHYLVDVLADCPGLRVAKHHALAATTEAQRQKNIKQLVREVQIRLQRLASWKENWDAAEPDCSYELPASDDTPFCTFADGTAGPAWSTAYFYNSTDHATTVALYHGTYIHLLLQLQIQDYGPEIVFPNLPQAMYQASIEICRGIDYHLQQMRSGAGSFFLMFAIRMAYQGAGTVDPAIEIWLKDVLKKIETGEAGRWALAGYVLNITDEDQERRSWT